MNELNVCIKVGDLYVVAILDGGYPALGLSPCRAENYNQEHAEAVVESVREFYPDCHVSLVS